MSTTAPEERLQVSDVLADLDSSADFESPSAPHRPAWGKWLVRGLIAVAFIALAVVGAGGWFSSMGSKAGPSLQTHTAKRGELIVTVTEDGNLESAANVDIKCEVAGGSTILWIIEDGKQVEEGAELVRLDSSQLEDQINQQRITYEKARASHIQADKDFEAAKISVQEYLEGTYRQELQTLEAQVTIAMENLRTAREQPAAHRADVPRRAT